jgi:serine/threonine protein phosphatase 1
MKTWVMGDIHGRHKALLECLKKSNFDYEKDTLILLGDIVDGGYNTYLCVEELLKIKNVIFVRGNHDKFFIDFMNNGYSKGLWIHQGGKNTLNSYGYNVKCLQTNYYDKYEEDCFINDKGNIPVTHQHFFNTSKFYHIQDDMLFVHGGFNDKYDITDKSIHKDDEGNDVPHNTPFVLMWDRDLIHTAITRKIKGFKHVFVGHTTTQFFNYITTPITNHNVTMLDTGAGWDGRLTIMDIETKEYWQSKMQIKPGTPGAREAS